MFSVNNHYTENDLSSVTTLTTYNTPFGSLVCNWNYTTDSDYFGGEMTATPTFKSGKYEKYHNLKLKLEGVFDNVGTRKLIVLY